MSARDTVEIGLNRFARRGYDLDEVSIVPSRRTRDVDDVSTAWQIDAFRFDIPLITSPSDAVVSPATAVAVGEAGGLGVLNAEGLWARYEDPLPVYRKLREAAGDGAPPVALLQEVYCEPVKPDLIAARIKEMRDAGVTTAVRVSPQHTLQLAPTVLVGRRGPAGHPGHDRLRRARHHPGRRAQPQGVHRRPRRPGHRGRGGELHDRAAPDAHRRGRGDRRRRRRQLLHQRRRPGHPGAAGQRHRRRRGRPPRLPRRDRRPVRARHRQRPDRDQRRDRPRAGLRCRRRPAGRAAAHRRARRPAAASGGTRSPRTRGCRAAARRRRWPRRGRCSRCCSARPRPPTAAPTCSVRSPARWPRPATATSRSSSGSTWSSAGRAD